MPPHPATPEQPEPATQAQEIPPAEETDALQALTVEDTSQSEDLPIEDPSEPTEVLEARVAQEKAAIKAASAALLDKARGVVLSMPEGPEKAAAKQDTIARAAELEQRQQQLASSIEALEQRKEQEQSQAAPEGAPVSASEEQEEAEAIAVAMRVDAQARQQPAATTEPPTEPPTEPQTSAEVQELADKQEKLEVKMHANEAAVANVAAAQEQHEAHPHEHTDRPVDPAVLEQVGKAEEAEAQAKIALAVAIKTHGDVQQAHDQLTDALRGAVSAKLEQLPTQRDVKEVSLVVDELVHEAHDDDHHDSLLDSAVTLDPTVVRVSAKLEDEAKTANSELRAAKADFEASLSKIRQSGVVASPARTF
eukprot:TRINITY_DN146_c0_g1_i1.p1 TRINITY_DN146_c0_g1~~TRINITY_DN146_c0_g1_i1.p1  ORF type:complete len:365 (+),score=151.43 TRINITY_DN146_c0_g1_i1:137-1231(+)